MGALRVAAALCLVFATSACSPTLDWREFRSPESGISLLFPCRPASQARTVRIAGQSVRLQLHACRAGDVTWALAEADMGAPAGVAAALDDLRALAVGNLAGQAGPEVTFDVPGATPSPRALRCDVVGKLPDGLPVSEHVGVFAVGTMVAQVTALGASLQAESVNSFFASARIHR